MPTRISSRQPSKAITCGKCKADQRQASVYRFAPPGGAGRRAKTFQELFERRADRVLSALIAARMASHHDTFNAEASAAGAARQPEHKCLACLNLVGAQQSYAAVGNVRHHDGDGIRWVRGRHVLDSGPAE